jgi:hypothetical protein
MSAALMWGLFFCPPLAAYVPPVPFLLQQMRQALGRADAFLVRQHVSIFTGGQQQTAAEVEETLKFWLPGRFRSDIDTRSMRRMHIVNGEKRLTAVNGRIAGEAENRYDRYKDIFLEQSGGTPESHADFLGVDSAITSPGRLAGRPVYVIGARYPDMTAAQIWLDKETFRPLRWVLPPSAGSREAGVLDVRYVGWRQAASIWYPKEVRFYVDGIVVRQIRVEGIEVVDGFEAALFDTDLLQLALEAAPSLGPRPPDAVEEVRAAIENFRRLYE